MPRDFSQTSFTGADKAPTVATSAFTFYDIESLHNIFTVAAYNTLTNHIFVFHLLDDDSTSGLTSDNILLNAETIKDTIREKNPALYATRQARGEQPPTISLHNLKKPSAMANFMRVLGGVNTDNQPHIYDASDPCPDVAQLHTTNEYVDGSCQILCDTHPDYDAAQYPFVMGYNSQNYDLTLLSVVMGYVFNNDSDSLTAAEIRKHNDNLFSDTYIRNMPQYVNPYNTDEHIHTSFGYEDHRGKAKNIYRSWINSGRHVDLARLNELQARVGLKRLLGMMGHQILESDRLSGHNARVDTISDVAELFAYNVSDVYGVALLLDEPTYSGSFDLRAGLLYTYPETVFEPQQGSFKNPDISCGSVSPTRKIINSSSAQFAATILAPYRNLRDIAGHNADLPCVSYRYPAEAVAREKGITPSNALTELRNFVHENITDETALSHIAEVYAYYRSVEGLNFNTTAPTLSSVTDQLRNIIVDLAEINDAYEDILDIFDTTFPERQYSVWETATEPTMVTLTQVRNLTASIREAVQAQGFKPKDIRETQALCNYLDTLYLAVYDSQLPFNPADDLNEDTAQLPFPARELEIIESGVGSVAERALNLAYVDGEGNPTSGFATFSTGGIHGAEYNLDAFHADNAEYEKKSAFFTHVVDTALQQIDDARAQREAGTLDGKPVKWLDAVDDWLANPKSISQAADVPAHSVVARYTPEQQAAAACWIRNAIRIDVTDPDSGEIITVEHGDIVKSTSRKATPFMRTEPKGVRHISLFPKKSTSKMVSYPLHAQHNGTSVNAAYTYTTVADVIHEDFTSYYPLLLTNMAAFANPDLAEGDTDTVRDRYLEIFQEKERYSKQMKDSSYTQAERDLFGVLRQGTKLILNSASGAGDATHPTKILMNNRIITMRILGQIFTWRVGQAQSLAGAIIASTNTDGLYSIFANESLNNEILSQQAEVIGVDIEPEPLTLVSKDSNNRIEFTRADPDKRPWERDIIAVGGGDLACAQGSNPTKALNHPALSDYVLAEYFKYLVGKCTPEDIGCQPETAELAHTPLDITQPMNVSVVHHILDELHKTVSPERELMFYQTIVAASPRTNTYPYAVPYTVNTDTDGTHHVIAANDVNIVGSPDQVLSGYRLVPVHPVQHYNRVFVVDPDEAQRQGIDVKSIVTIATATTRAVSERTAEIRAKNNEAPTRKELLAEHILTKNNVNVNSVEVASKDIVVNKVRGINTDTPVIMFNGAIRNSDNPDVLTSIINSLDRSAYVDMIVHTFENNWRNK